MSETPFERDLAAMFAEMPEAPDADAFIVAVDRQLDRHQRRRHWILGAFTAAGSAVAGGVVLEAGGLHRMFGTNVDLSASMALANNPLVQVAAFLVVGLAGLVIARPSLPSIRA